MGRGRGGASQQASRRAIDLTGVLVFAEKNDLLTLITAITEKMLKDICNIFDSPPISPIESEHGHHHWLSLPHFNHKENMVPSCFSTSKSTNDKTYAKTHQIIEKEEKEAMTPQLQELKKEALVFFRKWQNLVLQRVKDISIAEPTSSPANARGRGRGNNRGGPKGRGGRGGRTGRGGLTLATGPPRLPSKHTDVELAKRFPPIPNTLWTLPQERRKVMFHIIFLIVLSLQEYSANSYQLLNYLTSCLNLPASFFLEEEVRIAQALAQAALDVSPEAMLAQKAEEGKGSRKWKLLGNSTGGNGTLAPALLAADIGIGWGISQCSTAGLLGGMADTGRVIGGLFGMNPSKPTSKAMEIFSREIQDFAMMPLHGDRRGEYVDAWQTMAVDRRFRVVIAMSGWTTETVGFEDPWKCLGYQTEPYAVRWDLVTLLSLGTSLETVIKSSAWSSAQREIGSKPIFASLLESSWPTPLLKVGKIIDNPWNVGMVRAEKAGALLADAIMRHKVQGDRPVSLIGYSLAARVIYACLMVLAERRQFGIVESAVMMGAPAPSESRVWLTLKSVVSGRLINVYSENDYLLGFLYRTSNIQFGVAGLQEIQGADGVESYNAGRLPKGHLSYQFETGRILKNIGWDDLDSSIIPKDPPPRRRR